MKELWQYMTPLAGRPPRRMTIGARVRLWKRRRKHDDLWTVRGW